MGRSFANISFRLYYAPPHRIGRSSQPGAARRHPRARTRQSSIILGADGVEKKTAFELFSEFFVDRNNAPMSEIQSKYIKDLIEKIEGEEK